MPGEDGYSLIGKIKALELAQDTHTPAVALTAWSGDEINQRVRAAGFDSYLTKPVDPDDLTNAIMGLVRKVGRIRV
jgi:CheY-like chemotaxis protein